MDNLGQILADTVSAGPLILGLLAAAVAGLLSFASPCVIPLVPGYISYLAGVVGAQAEFTDEGARVQTKKSQAGFAAFLFVIGFTVVFLLATVTVFGLVGTVAWNQDTLMRIGGIITIVMGLVFMGFIKPLQTTKKMRPKKWTSLLGAPLLGGVFALGWTPCLGPTLAAIISISAGTQGTTALRGIALIIAYCIGLGLPFILLALGSSKALNAVGWLSKHSRTLQIIGGMTLIIIGILLVSGQWAVFVEWIRQVFVSDRVLPV